MNNIAIIKLKILTGQFLKIYQSRKKMIKGQLRLDVSHQSFIFIILLSCNHALYTSLYPAFEN